MLKGAKSMGIIKTLLFSLLITARVTEYRIFCPHHLCEAHITWLKMCNCTLNCALSLWQFQVDFSAHLIS